MTAHLTHPPGPAAPRAATLLRRALVLDSLATSTNGLIYLLAPGAVGDLLGVSSTLLVGLGVFLVGYGGFAGWLATCFRPPVPAVRTVVMGNALWAVLSLVVFATNVLEPTTAGSAWIVVQDVLVAGFAVAQQVTHSRLLAAERAGG